VATRYPGNAAFVQARHCGKQAGANLPIRRIVIHDMEWAEKPTTAEDCATMFAGADSPRASCHFMVDSNSVVQGVELDQVAWHAPPNTGSVGIEHAGRAGQSRGQWLDAYGKDMLWRSAALTSWLCTTLALPARWLTVRQLRAGERGLCTHADVSAAWHQTDHTDPGPGFPKDYYLAQVLAHMAGTAPDRGEPVTEANPTLTEIKKGVLFYPLDDVHVNPLTLLQRTYDLAVAQAGLLKAISQAQTAGETVDISALATAIVAGLPDIVVQSVNPTALATAVADKLAARLQA
jgi:hypothetical protein